MRGLRPVQIWVRDTRSEAYARRVGQQVAALRHDPHEQVVLAELDAIADRDGWT